MEECTAGLEAAHTRDPVAASIRVPEAVYTPLRAVGCTRVQEAAFIPGPEVGFTLAPEVGSTLDLGVGFTLDLEVALRRTER